MWEKPWAKRFHCGDSEESKGPLIREALQPYQSELKGCVVESTYNWYWLVDGLMESGYPIHLANTAAIRQYDGVKNTNDRTDARYLAQLLRLGILPEGYIYPKEIRGLRDLLRRRLLLVRQRTVQLLSLQSLIARHTGKRFSSNQIKQLDTDAIAALLPDQSAAFSGQVNLALMQTLDQAVDMLETKVLKQAVRHPEHQFLISVPGIGKILGMTIQLETGEIQRFPDAGHYASYARCVKSEKVSNGKRKGQGNRKNGNRYLAWAFVEAAHFATIWEPSIKRYYQRKLAKSHLMVAKKAVANKLARACYHMLKEHKPFDVRRSFG
ncbi:MAG: IS110 family transposase [Pseudomonadota bacterium]